MFFNLKQIPIFFLTLFFIFLHNGIIAQNTWTQKANFAGIPRETAVGFSIGTKGYFGTGGNPSNDFWEWDQMTNVWTQKANVGGPPRGQAVGFSIGTKGYIGTGDVGTLTFLKDFWEWDQTTNIWTQKTDFGGGKRWFATGFSIGSKGYIGMGGNLSGVFNDFWEYDPSTDTWTQKANFAGSSRVHAVGFAIGTNGYIGTGGTGTGQNSSNEFWEYNPSTNIWIQKANFGGLPRTSAVGFSIGPKGYIGTGGDDNYVNFFNDFWEYDPSTNTWIQKANFGGIGRIRAAGFSIGNKGYIGTGWLSSPPFHLNDFWEYDLCGSGVTPTVNITASPSGAICSGTSVTFTAVASNLGGGSVSIYDFKINGISQQSGASNIFTTTSLASGNAVTCMITITGGSCLSSTNATSNAITMVVNANVTPSVGITASSTTICAGTSVTFTATPTNGGTTPAYQWQVNGGNVGTNSPIYTTTTLANGDIVRVIMTSNAACASPTTTTSNTITMAVNPSVTPSVNISASSSIICAGASVTFTATPTNGGTIPSYQWQVNGGNVGTNSPAYTTTTLANGDIVRVIMTSNATCTSPTTATSNTITMTVNPTVTPSVNISASSTTICIGINVTFTATPTNGGTTPAYQWQVNGGNVGINSPTYTSATLANGDIVNVIMTSNAACASPTNATSNTITMVVNPNLTPTVTIAANPGGAICAGTSVTFTATPTNGGTTPAYQWQINSGNVGTNSATYTTAALVNGDIVRVIMTSNATCASPATATSNAITMTVTATVTPSVGIAASSTTICAGASVTFTATPTNGGPTPAYQWQVNGINAGTNSPTFTSATLGNGDIITVIMTSNLACASPTTATSNTIIMTVTATVAPSVNITASSTNICAGTSVTFTATPTNGGPTPVYQWQVNGINAGTNSPTFTSATLGNGDIVRVVMTSNAICVSPTTGTSNIITITVNPSLVPSVNIAANSTTICPNTSVTFTATSVNGGTAPVYQWQVNGVNVGTNSSFYTISSLANGDVVTAIMTSNAACATVNTVTSYSITMIVINTTVTPSVSIASSPGNICFGTIVTFTASPTNGGSTPSYQWKLNGSNTGTNSSTFISNTLANGDIINCLMTSNAVCAVPNTVPSNNITVVIDPAVCPIGFYMATAFTPNKDGKNDICKPTLLGNVISYKFSVYNRWGQKIFETTDLQKGWDGKVSGLETDSNVFVWVCSYQFAGHTLENRKGTVMLLH